jgi:asparagine synthase (glutamine-hydrolysing)
MCGIAGYVDFETGRVWPAVLDAMAAALARRGPDARGTLIEGPCGLAHARLSIIDLAGSPQPMRVGGSRVSLVYNGELYTYRDLREELVKQGIFLDTHGDTEMILRYVDHQWEKALDQFDGMFAFAAWDRQRERLLLARDPLGKKPLFYAIPSPGVLVFASEIKAVLEHPAVCVELDEDAVRQAVRFRAVYGDRSLYAGVRQVEPGCWLEITREGIRQGRFYDLPALAASERERIAGHSDQQLIDDGERMLTEAVRKRLVADVPVGAFLSGGLDSSLIVALMRQCRAPEEKTCTFSVGFRGDRNSELPFAQTVADAIGTVHTTVELTEQDYARRLAEMTACRDAPVSEPADVAIAQMSEVAKRTVKVVLSGEGSDEVFCGYPKYRFADASWALRAGIRAAGPKPVAALAGMLGMDRRRVLVLAQSLSQTTELNRLVQWFSYLDRGMLAELLPGLGWSDDAWTATTAPQAATLRQAQTLGFDPAARMQLVDCLTWLPGNLLERGDRMTMAAGLEARVPFLDRALAPWGVALPSRLKVHGKSLKWIVRQWAKRKLPPQILERPKWGFRVPLAEWFRGSLRSTVYDYLTSSRGLCARFGDVNRVRRVLDMHDAGVQDANLTLWTLLAAEVWYQDVFLSRDVSRRGTSLGGSGAAASGLPTAAA